MSFWDNVKKFAQPYDEDDYDDYDEELDDYEEPAQEPKMAFTYDTTFVITADLMTGYQSASVALKILICYNLYYKSEKTNHFNAEVVL